MTVLPVGHWIYNTSPHNYVLDISSAISSVKETNLTPSKRVVRALQSIKPEISTKGFGKQVLNAIFDDGVHDKTRYPGMVFVGHCVITLS